MKNLMRAALVALGVCVGAHAVVAGAADNQVKTGDLIELPRDFSADGAFTVSIWARFPRGINPYANHMRAALCSKGTRLVEPPHEHFVLSLYGGRPEFKYFSEKGHWHGLMRNDVFWCGNGVRVKADDLPRVKPDTWFRVTGVFDHGVVALYLDDKLYLMSSNNPTPPRNTQPVKIGLTDSPFGTHAERFPGPLAFPRFLSRAQGADEIAADYAAERVQLPKKVPPFNRNLQTFDRRFPREEAYSRNLPTTLAPRSNCVVRLAQVGGVPRVTIDGVPQAAMAMLPYYNAGTNETVLSAREFAAYGIRFFSDIQFTEGKRNDWWLGEGVYDWPRFEARMRALVSAAPQGWVFPRVKCDPPDWWRAKHPTEFMGNGRVKPQSAAWRALYTRMLREVVTHVESSELAGYVMGYQFGAYVGSEWLIRTPESNPEDVADAVLLAASVIKDVTHNNKLTGIFFGYPCPDHAAFGRLLESPLIDYYCGPTAYYGRRGGEPGRFSSNAQASMRLHGRLYWDEADLRTSICRDVVDYRCADMDESVACVKRAIGWALTAGEEVWWFLIAGNACFHDERLMDAVAIGQREEALTLTRGSRPVEDIAYFEPPAGSYVQRSGKVNYDMLSGRLMPQTGYTYGTYVLADLLHADELPAHKLALVPAREALTPEQRAACEKLTRRGMKVHYMKTTPKPDELRTLAREAGAHAWIDSHDTFAAGRDYVMLHANEAGTKAIRLPQKCDVVEIFGTAEPRTGVTTITDTFRQGETKVYRLTP